jgi:hypothetical protein
MRLYKRNVTLRVGPAGGEGINLTPFRISFEVEKTDLQTTNTAKITIYNLSRETKRKIEQGQRVILGAGHGDVAPVIFVGDVVGTSSTRDTLVLEAEDGGKAVSQTTISKTYKPGTSAKTMIDDISASLGLSGSQIPDIQDTLTAGFAAVGPAAEALTALTDKFGLSWQIQDDELIVVGPSEAISPDEYLLTYDSGLLDIPQQIDQDVSRTVTTKPLYAITSRLIGKLNPGRLVKVDSTNLKGVFRIQKLKHTGDNRGAAFYTGMEVIER